MVNSKIRYWPSFVPIDGEDVEYLGNLHIEEDFKDIKNQLNIPDKGECFKKFDQLNLKPLVYNFNGE